MPSDYPLPSSDLASLGFAARPIEHLDRLIQQHIEEGRYPGAQIALARHGQLALFRTYGNAKTEPSRHTGRERHAVPAVQPDQGADQFRACGRWWRRASCPSWTRCPTTCRNSLPAAKPTSRWSR